MYRLFACHLLWIALLLSPAARADALTFGILDVPPYGQQAQSQPPSGLFVDLMQQLAQRSQVTLTPRLLPYARISHELQAEKTDLTFLMANQQLEERAQRVGEIVSVRLVVQLRAGMQANKLSQLAGLRLARMRGGCSELFDNPPFTFSRSDVNEPETAIAQLAAGRIDGFCATTGAIAQAMRNHQLLPARFGSVLTISTRPVYLWARAGLPVPELAQLRQALESLRRDGSIDRVMASHHLP